jgi:hypothetical protein
MLVLTNIQEGAKMVSGISQTGNLSKLKAQYIEAQRTGDKTAMNIAKAEAMKIMNEVGEAEDTVEISEEAFTQYHSTN